MEYAEAGDLASHIAQHAQQQSPLSEECIISWFVQICLALWHVHCKGVLHRDLTAQNVFLSLHGVIKLGDFGISSSRGDTQDLEVMGAAHCLSPGTNLQLVRKHPYIVT